MRKIPILLTLAALMMLAGCKKDEETTKPFVSAETLINEVFKAGMNWNTQRHKSSIPINIQVDDSQTGPAGGYIHVLGAVTGNMTMNDQTGEILGGALFLQLTETINDYAVMYEDQKFTMNGAPNLSLVGNFTLAPGGQTFGTASNMVISGGFTVSGGGVTKTINLSITININPSGTGGDVSGSYDGKPINYTF